MTSPLIIELSLPGRSGAKLPVPDVPVKDVASLLPAGMVREEPPNLPEVSEVDVVRHYTRLSSLNYGVDTGFYPLGSCTMKYNPKINEDMAALPGFTGLHPYQPEHLAQGALALMYRLERYLCEIAGMDRFTLQPAAGAHGELTGMMIIKAYHEHRGETQRTKVIIPDSAHGTNPATATMVGCETVTIPSNERGGVDLDALRRAVGEDTAGLMLTNPNTLGLFDENIIEVCRIVHEAGGLVYCDGANMNAIMGMARPGDMGFDVVHLNLHKTFGTPHGGGGPGSGPVGVKEFLVPYLPRPLVDRIMDPTGEEKYVLNYEGKHSIGRVKSFYGNFGVMVKAYAYIRTLGARGLKEASEIAVLNANYQKEKLKHTYKLPYDRTCMHEFVLSAKNLKETGVRTLDIAKRLLDYGFHPGTIYFPLIVEEAMMIEPTETESKETLDRFIEALEKIAQEAAENPELVTGAPHTTPVKRLDDVTAARKPVLRW
ncbi:MAG: aminomethyl-transferring glycine dehydrogenase subunit GcvPB [Peptococcaceae bacterium]|nr:aminomethyl-transferring glycine dehydrogenase subunit GcvPB [Peptococcaceae bacterium]